MSELAQSDETSITPAHTKQALWEFVRVCLKIGATSFGAPTAHIAMMENEFVRRRKWISEELFLDALSAANLVPGPNASELCYHVGYIRAGYPGLILGGLAFITPAFITTVILAALYVRFGSLPQIRGMFYMLNPLVLAIVIDTTWRISKMSFKGWKQVLIFALAVLAKVLGLNETLILILAGVLGILFHHTLQKENNGSPPPLMTFVLPLISLSGLVNQAAAWWNGILAQIFVYFFKTGSVMFGSAMVLFALIEKDVTTRMGDHATTHRRYRGRTDHSRSGHFGIRVHRLSGGWTAWLRPGDDRCLSAILHYCDDYRPNAGKAAKFANRQSLPQRRERGRSGADPGGGVGVGAKRPGGCVDGAVTRVGALRAGQTAMATLRGGADWIGDRYCEHKANTLAYEDYSSRMIISRITPSIG
jgi:chromate transport protein ChrA